LPLYNVVCPDCEGIKDRRAKRCRSCAMIAARGVPKSKHRTHRHHPNSIRTGPQTEEHIRKRVESRGLVYNKKIPNFIKPYNLARMKWGRAVKKRDGLKCVICYSTQKLEAHHILTVNKHPELALILHNGITLCHSCHWDEHRLNGYL